MPRGIFFIIGLLLVASMAQARSYMPWEVDPFAETSADGVWVLEINPENRFGHGPASYRMLKDGEPVWEKRLNYTLMNLTVLNDGTVAGFGMGSQSDRAFEGDRIMAMAILAPSGEPRLSREIPPTFVGWGYGPWIYAYKVDTDEDKVSFALSGGDFQSAEYRLSTGDLIREFDPKTESDMDSYTKFEWRRSSFSEEEFPLREPKKVPVNILGTIEFEGAQSATSPYDRPITDFSVTADGHFAVLNRGDEKTSATLTLYNRGAQSLNKMILPHLDLPYIRVLPLGGEEFLLVASSSTERKSLYFRADLGTREIQNIQTPELPETIDIDAFPDGGFAVLVRYRSKYTMWEELYILDKDGRQQAMVPEGQPRDPKTLFSPMDIAIMPDEQIVVLEGVGRRLNFFDRQGEAIREIELTEVIGKEPNYPINVEAMPDGGMLFVDFVRDDMLYRLDDALSVYSSGTARYESGMSYRGIHRVGPMAGVWSSNYSSIFRLDDTGKATEQIAIAAEPGEPIQFLNIDVLPDGKIYAVDRIGRSVHAYDDTGKRLFIGQSTPDDMNASFYSADVTRDNDGNVYMSSDGIDRARYLKFDAKGNRLGMVTTELDTIHQQWQFVPGTENRWVSTMYTIYLIDAAQNVLKTVRHQPNNKWLPQSPMIEVGLDGSLAVRGETPECICIFSAEGEPEVLIRAPERFFHLSYDGRYVAFCVQDKVYVYTREGKPLCQIEFPGRDDHLRAFLMANRGEIWINANNAPRITRVSLPLE